MANKTLEQLLNEILANQAIYMPKINTILANSENSLNLSNFHSVLGQALNKNSTVVKVLSPGEYDFKYCFPFGSSFYLTEELKSLLNLSFSEYD